jgi:hypothetical protein
LHKAHRSLHPRGILTSLEVLSLFPNCSVTDADTDLQQQKLQGDAFKKEMTSKYHRHLIWQAGSWHFSRKDFKMVGSTPSRQCLQQGKVAKQLRSRQHRQSQGRISPDAPHLPFTWIAAAKNKRPDQISTTTPSSLRHSHHDRHTPYAVGFAPTPGLQSCYPPRRSNTMAKRILKLKPTRPFPSGDNSCRRCQI